MPEPSRPNLALFGMLGLVLVFLRLPLFKCCPNNLPSRIVNVVLICATVAVFSYIFVQSERLFERLWIDGTLLGDRAGNEKLLDYIVAGIGLVLVLEATRRAIGWTLPILCLIFIAYAVYGQSMPDWLFPHRGANWQQIAQKTFLQSGGVFGIALRVMFTYVFLFVLFGTLLEQTGATAYVIKFARRMFKNSSGGPAKVAVVSSGLMGSLSGSAVANTATTGTFTIPLMKSSGFNAESAGGVEAAASSGGALMPPIMGAGAYMMLEMVEPAVTYVEIIKAALIPAILYYTALLMTVHFHAKRIGAAAEAEIEDDEPMSAYQGVVFFGSFVILIAMLVSGFTPFRAVSVSLIGILILSLFSKFTRLDPQKILSAFAGAAKGGMALIVAASCVGIILGIVDMTGLGAALPAKVQAFANESAILALVGSVLDTLDTPPLAAHLFIFYFGMMSMVTPPVALAAYAGAAISKGDVMRTAFSAFRFALVGFALPFAFVLKPELLMLTRDNQAAGPLMIAATVGITLIAIWGLSASIAGFASKKIGLPLRAALLLLSLTIFFTRWQGVQLAVQLVAAVMIIGLLFWNAKSAGAEAILNEGMKTPQARYLTTLREIWQDSEFAANYIGYLLQ